MTRQEVYRAIDHERECQNNLNANLVSRKPRAVSKELSAARPLLKIELMRGFLEKARNTWWSREKDGTALASDDILKVTALGVSYLEEHGISAKEIAKLSRKKIRMLALSAGLRNVLKK